MDTQTKPKAKANAKLYYIGERHNPQFKKPYYCKYGQLSKTEVKKKENSSYGSLYVTGYASVEEYNTAIENLKQQGFNIH